MNENPTGEVKQGTSSTQPGDIPTETIESVADLPFVNSPWQHWYRGHANGHWELRASIFRHSAWPEWESRMYRIFCNLAPVVDKNFPLLGGVQDERNADALFIMRHHGFPTRVLDWTESPLVALYFAVTNTETEVDGCLWRLNPFQLNRSITGGWGIFPQNDEDGIVKSMVNRGFDRKTSRGKDMPISVNGHIAVKPRWLYRRQSVQQAVYTLQDKCVSMEQLSHCGKFLSKFIILAQAKKAIREELLKLGVNEFAMFPDMDGLGRHLLEIYHRKQYIPDP